MSGDEFTEVPDSVDTGWTNPIIALYQEESEKIQILDELAIEYGIGNPEGSFSESPLPSHVIYMLCELNPIAIQTAAVRLYRTTRERFTSLSDARFEELLAESWSGDLADRFRDWVEGGGGYQGINVYFEEVHRKAESTSLVLLNLGERLKTSLSELDTSLREDFAALEDLAAVNGHSLSSLWSNVLGAGGFVGGIIGAIAANVFVILFSIIAIIIFIWDYYRVTAEDVRGSIEAMGEFHGAVSGQAGGTGTDGLTQSEFEGTNGDG
jgi:hypothetical protein